MLPASASLVCEITGGPTTPGLCGAGVHTHACFVPAGRALYHLRYIPSSKIKEVSLSRRHSTSKYLET